MLEPVTRGEWQDAAAQADLLLRIESARMYGLIETDLVINVSRCEKILETAREKKITPRKRL